MRGKLKMHHQTCTIKNVKGRPSGGRKVMSEVNLVLCEGVKSKRG